MKGNSLFRSLEYVKVMSLKKFESILQYLRFSSNADPDQQILDFVESLNKNFQSSLAPGFYVTLDESMIKSFHRNLKGKIKIIRKPRPIGNEIKNLSDAMSNIVLNLELYKGKEIMSEKDFVKQYGAATATTLQLTQSYYGTGKRVVADS